MAELKTGTFSKWELSDLEEREGSIFTITQTQVLQNQLALCAEEKLVLEFDTANPKSFTQQEAYKRGQIEMIQHLLDLSETLQTPEPKPEV